MVGHDSVVPYAHSVKLHDALIKSGNVSQLLTITGGDHGMFAQKDYESSFEGIWKFLEARGIK